MHDGGETFPCDFLSGRKDGREPLQNSTYRGFPESESLVQSCSVQKPATRPMPQLAPVFEATLPMALSHQRPVHCVLRQCPALCQVTRGTDPTCWEPRGDTLWKTCCSLKAVWHPDTWTSSFLCQRDPEVEDCIYLACCAGAGGGGKRRAERGPGQGRVHCALPGPSSAPAPSCPTANSGNPSSAVARISVISENQIWQNGWKSACTGLFSKTQLKWRIGLENQPLCSLLSSQYSFPFCTRWALP